MKSKIFIPEESVNSTINKIKTVTDGDETNDSVNSKILALNQIIRGWCRYYQYASVTITAFRKIEYTTFWRMTHWLSRKFKISTQEVIKRFCKNHIFTNGDYKLIKATHFRTLRYPGKF